MAAWLGIAMVAKVVVTVVVMVGVDTGVASFASGTFAATATHPGRATFGTWAPARVAGVAAAPGTWTLAVTHPCQHLGAGGFGGCLHHLAARWFAGSAPDGLATHGDGFSFFTGLGHEFFDDLYRNILLGEAFNGLHETFFVKAHKVDGLTVGTGAPCAANAVHIVFTDVGDVVIDHMRQIVNVDAARRNVGCHQGTDIAALEIGQGLGAGGLTFVAMQRHGMNPVFAQKLGHIVGTEFGPGKHQHLAPVVLLNDVGQQGFLFTATHRMYQLGNALHGGVAWRDLHTLRIFQQGGREFADFVAEGG
ncbi:hypothetical protein GALL_462810 [mine drainage metagenome]|uniref:Uncharacterized protein n=1 Tax=mine drainage metagenome TaxID=410659 RepID=A0A1J5PLQ7_9ZZZZ